MVDALLDIPLEQVLHLLGTVAAVALCGVAFAAWWWETSGRREHEREEWRRGMAERLPPGRRGERLWTEDDDEPAI